MIFRNKWPLKWFYYSIAVGQSVDQSFGNLQWLTVVDHLKMNSDLLRKGFLTNLNFGFYSKRPAKMGKWNEIVVILGRSKIWFLLRVALDSSEQLKAAISQDRALRTHRKSESVRWMKQQCKKRAHSRICHSSDLICLFVCLFPTTFLQQKVFLNSKIQSVLKLYGLPLLIAQV